MSGHSMTRWFPGAIGLISLPLLAVTAGPAFASGSEAVSIMLLQCFHPSGRLIRYHTWGRFSGDVNYLADDSETYDIAFRDAKTAESRMEVALMFRRYKGRNEATAAVLSDTSPEPAKEDVFCRKWMFISQ